jgi:hypothetical protein
VPIKVDERVESQTLAVPALDQHRQEILTELERLWTWR